MSRNMKKKIVWLPYDMDTAIGISNSGVLSFDYRLEDIDQQEGGADVFNGQDSVVWKNVRAAFFDDIKSMYQTLRSNSTDTTGLSYKSVEKMFEDHQNKWCEALYNEDSWFKYILPFINNNQNYLDMCLGSKAEQRKWWLYNRFKYIDSKYVAGESSSDQIMIRPYTNTKETIYITPYADIYATVKWDDTITQVRANRNTTVSIESPYTTMNDNIVNIYNASQLASIGDLSPFRVGEVNLASATKIQSLKIGDSDVSYNNSNLRALTLGNNVLLRVLDVSNCSGLGTRTQKSVDASGCSNIEEVYFDGTNITSIALPNGGVLRVLHLPETITSLTIMNQPNITDLVADVSNEYFSTLRIENCPTIDTETLLRTVPASTRIRLVGFSWEAEDSEEIEELLDLLDTMRGLDVNGNNLDDAWVEGIIHTSYLTGDQIDEYNTRYPYLRITATHTETTLTYKTWDGSSIISTVTCIDGVPQSASPSIPSRTSTAQYNFTGIGWNSRTDASANDPACITNVNRNRTVYAAYSRTTRTYTITWKNSNNATLEVDTNVPYGTTPTYNGSTPVDPSGQGSSFTTWYPTVVPVTGNAIYTATYKPVYTVIFKSQDGTTTLDTKQVVQGNTATYTGETPTNADQTTFLGWSNSMNSSNADAVLTNIQSDKTVYAAFESLVEIVEITDTWDEIIANIDNGTYKDVYKVGNYKSINLSGYGTVNMQIVSINGDELVSGGNAPLTFMAKAQLNQKMALSSGGINSYINSNLRVVLNNNVYYMFPSNIRTRIQNVNKTYYDKPSNSTKKSIEKIWIPSYRELAGVSYRYSYESYGVTYSSLFNSDSRRKLTSTDSYWTRTPSNTQNMFHVVGYDGKCSGFTSTTVSDAIIIGFCLGLPVVEDVEITDSWDTIMANIDNGTYGKYSLGNYKPLDLGSTYGTVNMQIVAIDGDDLENGGKAPLTFVAKELLNVTSAMNTTNTNENGYPATQTMKPLLDNTIYPLISPNIRNRIQNVNKTYYDKTSSSTKTSVEKVWIPSAREIFGGTGYENNGITYTIIYKNNNSRKKKKESDTSTSYWWTRSAYSTVSTGFYIVDSSGYLTGEISYESRGVCIGFCLGLPVVEDVEITDSWDTIIANIDNGTYKNAYKVGNYKPLDLGSTYGTVNMQIVAIDGDDLENGGKAPLTFVAKEQLKSTTYMDSLGYYGYYDSNVREWLNERIYPLISPSIRTKIQNINKTYYTSGNDYRTKTSTEKLWIPSAREIFGNLYEDNGIMYKAIYKDNTSRIKTRNGTAQNWLLRSANDNTYYYCVGNNGVISTISHNNSGGIVVGFCLGIKESETITDSWSEIFANEDNETYSTKYSVGDTKSININGEQHLMQIVAFDADERADSDTSINNGKAKITWIMRDLLGTTHNINSNWTVEGGWALSDMRAWLRNTILPTIDSTIRDRIVEVNKTYSKLNSSSTRITDSISDTIWIPSHREMYGNAENSGVQYLLLSNNLIRKRNNVVSDWWTRSCHYSNNNWFYYVTSSGGISMTGVTYNYGVCVCFCT